MSHCGLLVTARRRRGFAFDFPVNLGDRILFPCPTPDKYQRALPTTTQRSPATFSVLCERWLLIMPTISMPFQAENSGSAPQKAFYIYIYIYFFFFFFFFFFLLQSVYFSHVCCVSLVCYFTSLCCVSLCLIQSCMFITSGR